MTNKTVLIVDDEPDILELLEITLRRMGLDTRTAGNLAQAREQLAAGPPDLCLSDMRLPDGNGIDLVHEIQQNAPQVPVAIITAHGSVDSAISALKAGAFDFVSKPLELNRLRELVTTALNMESTGDQNTLALDQKLTGSSEAVQGIRQQIVKLARSQAPVHISGESGAGKEVVARLIHRYGPRAQGPFVPVNCGAIPAELMESEFFGHIKGSFTGATQDKAGLFQAAHGGTLFLDEIADLPLAMQVKLLRVIQEKAVRPVGSTRESPIDVRILSASHKNLAEEVHTGRFRNDLYYRINVIDIKMPALRERREDIPELARVLLHKICEKNGITEPQLHPTVLDALQEYYFPGNVRELENLLEGALALCDGKTVYPADLQFPRDAGHSTGLEDTAAGAETAPASWSPREAFGDLEGYLEDIERRIISAALEESRWNKTNAARLLGISFRSLRYRTRKLGLDD